MILILPSTPAAYHDVHHDVRGIKSNFSQPYFTFWDHVCGTYLDPAQFHLTPAQLAAQVGKGSWSRGRGGPYRGTQGGGSKAASGTRDSHSRRSGWGRDQRTSYLSRHLPALEYLDER
jgi:hypothetical protein